AYVQALVTKIETLELGGDGGHTLGRHRTRRSGEPDLVNRKMCRILWAKPRDRSPLADGSLRASGSQSSSNFDPTADRCDTCPVVQVRRSASSPTATR
ncbi:hypothetical protein L6R52_39510, partial [Myxococcota bacterium]|nr:hypothetical protein [Myxococcota bacterium]